MDARRAHRDHHHDHGGFEQGSGSPGHGATQGKGNAESYLPVTARECARNAAPSCAARTDRLQK